MKLRSHILTIASLLALPILSPAFAQAPAPEPIPAPPDVAAPPADAQTTASGLASRVLSPGTGTDHPKPGDSVKVHYTGWTTDGKMFDSSVARGKPTVLPLDRVIAGWGEGLQLMVEGEKRRLWIPAKLAYEGRPDRPQGMLVFDVELLDILRVPPPPPDVAAPPADAEVTKSGLASKRLSPGTGTRHPRADSNVRVHYTGWTTDGKMFDSSVAKGTPAVFNLRKVIPGWTEGLQLMVEGETRRFWIPKKLAYRGQQGMPEGMLVFDVELIEITKL
ncbi:MAG TPA: FKBP-type peptidyl-prolyl cis-trans isomerase [Thermoanaerobaculia bacterium]